MTGAHSAGAVGRDSRRRTRGPVPSWWLPPRPNRFGRRAAPAVRAGRARSEEGAAVPRHARGAVLPAPRDGGARSARPVGRGRAGGGRRRAAPAPGPRRLRLAGRIALGGLAALLLGPLLAFALGYLLLGVPTPDRAGTDRVTLVSYSDGSPLTRLVPSGGDRAAVALADVPRHVRDAVLAAEDRSDRSRPGSDPTGLLRAVGGRLRGGSGAGPTLVQRYVQDALGGGERSLWRTLQEVVLVVKVARSRTEDEVLGDYLNAVYFGRGAHGIGAASQAYFGKPVQLLDVGEGALLAGVIRSPSRWDPAVDAEAARRRVDSVLDGMVERGRLTPADRAATAFPATAARQPAADGLPADAGAHVVRAVQAELEASGIASTDLARDGLRITTTVDRVQQRHAGAAVERALRGQPDDLRAALVAIDPATGGITAYHGGADGAGPDQARVRRPPGSTFTPFAVLAGLAQGPPVGLGEQFDGAGGAGCSRCDLKQATTVSDDAVFDALAREVGPEAVAAAARAAGITSPLEDPTPRTALGDRAVGAVELASAYATVAAGGVHRAPHLVAEVVASDGTVLYRAPRSGERRFSGQVARNAVESMLDVAGAAGLDLPAGRPVAARTGTVPHGEGGGNSDAWTAGFTPSLASVVRLGTDRGDPVRTAGGEPVTGGGLPGRIWQQFLGGALEDRPAERFPAHRPLGEPASDDPPGPDPGGPPAPAPPARGDGGQDGGQDGDPGADGGDRDGGDLLLGTGLDCSGSPCG